MNDVNDLVIHTKGLTKTYQGGTALLNLDLWKHHSASNQTNGAYIDISRQKR